MLAAMRSRRPDGGGFILSTGDPCSRDAPDDNILTLIEVARSYGRY